MRRRAKVLSAGIPLLIARRYRLANKEIAQNLRIATNTVKQHAKAVYAALGVSTRTQAGRAAQRRGIELDR